MCSSLASEIINNTSLMWWILYRQNGTVTKVEESISATKTGVRLQNLSLEQCLEYYKQRNTGQ